MNFKNRFVLLRGNKTSNEIVEKYRPQLVTKNSPLNYWRGNQRYFLIDLEKNEILLHFRYLTSANKSRITDISCLDEYKIVDYSVSTFQKIAKSMSPNPMYWDNEVVLENVYSYENIWFMISYKYVGEMYFIINSKSFLDFEVYFNRTHKISRFLHDN